MYVQFSARVPRFKYGYQWQYNGEVGEWLIDYRLEKAPQDEVRRNFSSADRVLTEYPDSLFDFYDPFVADPALFRNFAELGSFAEYRSEEYLTIDDDKPNRVLQFVNRYGDLSGSFAESSWIEMRQLGKIHGCASWFRAAVELQEAVRRSDEDRLARFLEWDNQFRRWTFRHTTVLGAMFNFSIRSVPATWTQKGHIVDRGKEALELTITHFLSRQQFRTAIARQPLGPRTVLTCQVSTLLDAMWMQFASAVADEKQYQQCAFCHKWFSKGEAAAGRRRRREDQTFCTQSCRVKAYQHRQTKARQMRRNGTKLPDIARTVATDLPTLKKWLGE